jgi:hypothetical protein
MAKSGAELLASDTERLGWLPVISRRGSWAPVWSHDSSSVVLIALEEGTYTLMRVRTDGTGRIQRQPISPVAAGGQPFSLEGNQLVVAGALTRDGRRLVFTVGNQIFARFGVLDVHLGGTSPLEWKVIDRVYDMSGASLSPDDRWIAYQSQQAGIYHAYIDRFPDMNDPKQISGQEGGSNPVWSRDGREVFFRRSDGAMMAVPVTTTPTLKIGNATMLFESEGYGTGARLAGGGGRLWDVAPDGRFLMPKEISPRVMFDRIVVVQNWSEELNRLVSVP